MVQDLKRFSPSAAIDTLGSLIINKKPGRLGNDFLFLHEARDFYIYNI